MKIHLKKLTSFLFLLLSGLVLAPPQDALAQSLSDDSQVSSNTTGLLLRAYVSGNSLSDGEFTESGAGFGAKLGYGFTSLFTGYLGVNAASMTEGAYALAFADLGAQFNFRAGEAALVPYVDVALSGIGLDNGISSVNGSGLTAGGGIKYFVSPVLALDGGLFLNFSDIEGMSLGAGRLNLGISWFPMR